MKIIDLDLKLAPKKLHKHKVLRNSLFTFLFILALVVCLAGLAMSCLMFFTIVLIPVGIFVMMGSVGIPAAVLMAWKK